MDEQAPATATEIAAMMANFAYLRVRDDLEFLDGNHLVEEGVLVHDPLRWEYLIIGRTEYELLAAIDECETPEQLQERFKARFDLQIHRQQIEDVLALAREHWLLELSSYPAPLRISGAQRRRFGAGLESAARVARRGGRVIVIDRVRAALSSGDARAIATAVLAKDTGFEAPERRELYDSLLREVLRKSRLKISFMMSRVDLFDPTPLLRVLAPVFGWLYTPWVFLVALVLGALALRTPYDRFDFLLRMRDPGAAFISAWQGALFIAAALVSSAAHELVGHALALFHFGGRVRSVGLMVFMYMFFGGFANVSDSYRLQSRRQRLVVALAGIMVNLLLALGALACLPWVDDGSPAHVLTCAMFLVNTALASANSMPWLRLDGYYVLTDLMNISNLDAKMQTVGRAFWAWLLAGEKPSLELTGMTRTERIVATVLYVGRSVFMVAVVAFWFKFLLPRFTAILGLAGLVGFALTILRPYAQSIAGSVKNGALRGLARTPKRWPVAAAIVFLLFVLPIPWSQDTPATVEPARELQVVAPAAALVTTEPERTAREYSRGEVLFVLESATMDFEVAQARSELTRAELQAAVLRQGASPHERAAVLARINARKAQAQADLSKFEELDATAMLRGGSTIGDRNSRAQAFRRQIGSATLVAQEERRSAATVEGALPEELGAAEARREEAAARLAGAERRREALVVRAPFAGRFIPSSRSLQGAWVAAGFTLGAFIDTGNLRVVARVLHETAPGRLAFDRSARVRLADVAAPIVDTRLGSVRGHDQESYRVELEALPARLALQARPGMSAVVGLPIVRESMFRHLWLSLLVPAGQQVLDVLP